MDGLIEEFLISEGGCYAKCINLRKEDEPQIWNAIKFGSVMENVIVDEQTREPIFDDSLPNREHSEWPTL